MKPRVCFIVRRDADTPSIEHVFEQIAREFGKQNLDVRFVKVPFGNGPFGVLGNLLFFRKPDADIFHITGHVHYIALRLPPEKAVLTVHDLGILKLRSGLRRWVLKKLFFDWPFRRLRAITAISNATRLEIIELTECEPEKITIVDDPLSKEFVADTKEFNAHEPTVLQVGTAPHKNLARLIEALKDVRCRLLVVGRLEPAPIELLRRSGVAYENPRAETDEEMRAIYRRTDILAFCSTFEGFGLPIIEAQGMRVPVVTSDLPPMNDVAGGGAVFVNPMDANDIRSGIISLIKDPALRERIVNAGVENIARFEPAKIARRYRDVYDRLSSGRS